MHAPIQQGWSRTAWCLCHHRCHTCRTIPSFSPFQLSEERPLSRSRNTTLAFRYLWAWHQQHGQDGLRTRAKRYGTNHKTVGDLARELHVHHRMQVDDRTPAPTQRLARRYPKQYLVSPAAPPAAGTVLAACRRKAARSCRPTIVTGLDIARRNATRMWHETGRARRWIAEMLALTGLSRHVSFGLQG